MLRSLTHRVRLTLLSLTVPMKGRYFPTYPKRPQCRPEGQRDAGPGHDSLAPLAYSVRQTSSVFAYRADESSELSHKQKRPLSRPVRVLRPCQKAAKGGKGEGEGKESPERKTVGRGKGGKCRLLYQFCLFPSLLFPEGCPLWASPSVTLDPDTLPAAEGCAGHVDARKLAPSPGETYSAFANGTNESSVLRCYADQIFKSVPEGDTTIPNSEFRITN